MWIHRFDKEPCNRVRVARHVATFYFLSNSHAGKLPVCRYSGTELVGRSCTPPMGLGVSHTGLGGRWRVVAVARSG